MYEGHEKRRDSCKELSQSLSPEDLSWRCCVVKDKKESEKRQRDSVEFKYCAHVQRVPPYKNASSRAVVGWG